MTDTRDATPSLLPMATAPSTAPSNMPTKVPRKRSCLVTGLVSFVDGAAFGSAIGGIIASAQSISGIAAGTETVLISIGHVLKSGARSGVSLGAAIGIYSGGVCSLEKARNKRDALNPFLVGGVIGAVGAVQRVDVHDGQSLRRVTAISPRAMLGGSLSSAMLCSLFWWLQQPSRLQREEREKQLVQQQQQQLAQQQQLTQQQLAQQQQQLALQQQQLAQQQQPSQASGGSYMRPAHEALHDDDKGTISVDIHAIPKMGSVAPEEMAANPFSGMPQEAGERSGQYGDLDVPQSVPNDMGRDSTDSSFPETASPHNTGTEQLQDPWASPK